MTAASLIEEGSLNPSWSAPRSRVAHIAPLFPCLDRKSIVWRAHASRAESTGEPAFRSELDEPHGSFLLDDEDMSITK